MDKGIWRGAYVMIVYMCTVHKLDKRFCRHVFEIIKMAYA